MLRFLPLLVFLLLAVFLAMGIWKQTAKALLPLTEQADTLPAFSLEPLDGKKEVLTDKTIGNEPYLINFFASWCANCVDEHPVLKRIAESGEVKTLGVAWKDKPEKSREWLEHYGNPYYRAASDGGRLLVELGGTGVPETYIVDKKNIIRFRMAGPITSKDWEQTVLPLIQKLKQEQ